MKKSLCAAALMARRTMIVDGALRENIQGHVITITRWDNDDISDDKHLAKVGERAMQEAEIAYPKKDGWRKHVVALTRITDETIQEYLAM